MAFELSLPAKVGAGASAAAAGSLAIAGGAGAFKGNSATAAEDQEELEVRERTEIKDSEISEFSTKDLEEEDESETEFTPLEQQLTPFPKSVKEKQDNYDSNSIGKKYEKYLASAKSTEQTNKEWWSKQFEKFQQKDNSSNKTRESSNPFSTAPTSAFSETPDTDTNSLNSKCHSIYKSTEAKTQLETLPSSDEEETKTPTSTWNDLWTYCTNFLYSPLTLQDRSASRTVYSATWASEVSEGALSDFYGDNYYLWIYLNSEFLKLEETAVDGEYFKSFLKTAKTETNLEESKKTTLKQICTKAYDLAKTEGEPKTSPTKEEILKYCSIEVAS